MAALRPAVGVFMGVAAAVVLWNLIALGVGVAREFDRENDNALLVQGDTPEYDRYEARALGDDVEALLAWAAVAVAFLAVPNRHWLPSWQARGALQAAGAAGSLLVLFLLFVHRAEFSPGNRPYTLSWIAPVLAVAAAGTFARAWLSRDAPAAP